MKMKKKKIGKIIEEARKLEEEPEPIPSVEEAVEIYEEGIEIAEKIKKAMAKPWFRGGEPHPKRKVPKRKVESNKRRP